MNNNNYYNKECRAYSTKCTLFLKLRAFMCKKMKLKIILLHSIISISMKVALNQPDPFFPWANGKHFMSQVRQGKGKGAEYYSCKNNNKKIIAKHNLFNLSSLTCSLYITNSIANSTTINVFYQQKNLS